MKWCFIPPDDNNLKEYCCICIEEPQYKLISPEVFMSIEPKSSQQKLQCRHDLIFSIAYTLFYSMMQAKFRIHPAQL